jgi:3-hydroxyisobutyrate dehydrogenase-like beta-hydroxyacid dehydrogenase
MLILRRRVRRNVFFDSRAADAMKRGSVFIDMASIPPKMAQEHRFTADRRLCRQPGGDRRRVCPG